ncbi:MULTISPECIES: sigma-E processing peptidase SpoIIGA [Gracilibacillus]|uniref:sigma-E processing peptidase SpoIIGA n=1 Tax=Gracilibacillus TaxID=74385 RepID=UPI000826717D|nr:MULTISPECIES: sigma-E processing peptidase SpoIIGA [Gracilibacillus]
MRQVLEITKSKRRKWVLMVYIEVIWLLNFLLDWMILLLTQSITKRITPWYRLMLASVFGSLIVPFTFIFPDIAWNSWVIKIGYSFFIIGIAFPFRNLASYGKVLCSFYFMTFAIGGGLLAMHFLLSSENHTSQPYIASQHIHGLFVLVGFPLAWWFAKHRMDQHKLQQFNQQFYYQVKIGWLEKIARTTGYLDSGNHLVDPISQSPVIIVDETILTHFLDPEKISILRAGAMQTGEIEDDLAGLFHILPYRGVSGEYEMMIAFRPEYVEVDMPDFPFTTKKVLIGIQFGNLVADHSYHCLLHPKLFQQAG